MQYVMGLTHLSPLLLHLFQAREGYEQPSHVPLVARNVMQWTYHELGQSHLHHAQECKERVLHDPLVKPDEVGSTHAHSAPSHPLHVRAGEERIARDPIVTQDVVELIRPWPGRPH